MHPTPDAGHPQRPQLPRKTSSRHRRRRAPLKSTGKAAARRRRRLPEHWLIPLARQFVHLSIFKVMEIAPTDCAAEDLFIHARWKNGVTCPWQEAKQCTGGQVHELKSERPRRFRCTQCRRTFSVRTEADRTGMHAPPLPYIVWVWAIYFRANTPGLKIDQLRRYLGITKDAARRLYHTLPGPLRQRNPEPLTEPPPDEEHPLGFISDPWSRKQAQRAQKPGQGSITYMMDRFPDNGAAEQWLINLRHRYHGGMECPSRKENGCTGKPVRELPADGGPQKFRCSNCGHEFTVRTDTVMHASPLPCHLWVWATYFMVNTSVGISASRLARYLGIRKATAHHVAHRIREGMQEIAPPLLGGVVEADETIWRFRGFPYRLYAVVILSRNLNIVRVVTVLSRTRVQLRTILKALVDRLATLCTDGWSSYEDLGIYFYHHEQLIHKDRDYAHKIKDHPEGLIAHVNGAESFNGKERLAARSVYKGQYSPQHAALYHIQDAWLHNHQKLPVLERMAEAMSQTVGRRLTLAQLRRSRARLEELAMSQELSDGKVAIMLDRYAGWMLHATQIMLIPYDELPPPAEPRQPQARRRRTKPRRPHPTLPLPGFQPPLL